MKHLIPNLTVLVLMTALLPIKGTAAQSVDTLLNHDMCLNSMIDRYLGGQDSTKDINSRLKQVSDGYEAQKKKGFNFFNGPWERGLTPLLDAQEDAFMEAALYTDPTMNSLDKIESLLNAQQTGKLNSIVQETAKEFGGHIRKIEDLGQESQDPEYQKQVSQKSVLLAACAQISLVEFEVLSIGSGKTSRRAALQ